MAWIASDQKNRDHPKIIRAARALGISKVTMIGHTHLLWYWALDYAQDGELSAFDAADIAEAAEWTGDPDLFIAALVESAKIGDKPGLLEYVNGILTIHDWHDYAGKLIDRRREDAERKRISRGADVRKTSVGHPQDIRGMSGVEHPTVEYPTQQNTRVDHHAPAAPDEDEIPQLTPERRAIQNAYDACGLMLSKTHQDAHLETIKRTGLQAWQQGWAKAMEASKHNIPAYVARCAESAMLAAQRSNGNGRSETSRGFGLASLTTDADREYWASNSPEAIAELQAEFDRNAAERAAKQASSLP